MVLYVWCFTPFWQHISHIEMLFIRIWGYWEIYKVYRFLWLFKNLRRPNFKIDLYCICWYLNIHLSVHLFRCEDLYNYNAEERLLWIVIVENCWNFRCNVNANRCPFYLSVYLIQQVITILVCEIKKSLKNFHALKM